jgi:heptosyltransferase III
MNSEPRRITVFRTGYLGDTLVALPAFWTIRKTFPDAHITLLSNSDIKNPHYVSARNVLPSKGLFDSWMSYPSSLQGLNAIKAYAELAARIRKGRYDSLIYLMPRGRTMSRIKRDAWFFRFAGIKNVLGIRHALANLLSERPPLPSPRIKSEAEFLSECLRSENIFPAFQNRDLCDLLLTESERRAAESFLETHIWGLVDRSRLIAVGPGSKWPKKTWSEERFIHTVSWLIRDHGVFPVVFGGKEDREIADQLITAWGTGANAAGVLNVRESAAFIERCALYLGNDTGTMHLAATMGVRCVAIFAANNWAGQWYPVGDGNRVFRPQVACEGCVSPADARFHECLDAVGVGEVLEACSEVLAQHASEKSKSFA